MTKFRCLLGLLAVVAVLGPPVYAVTINLEGPDVATYTAGGGRPVAVPTAAPTIVFNGNANRSTWSLYAECTSGTALRCNAGTVANAAPSPEPAASPSPGYGFAIPCGVIVPEETVDQGSRSAANRIDCTSMQATGINVDTWEEP